MGKHENKDLPVVRLKPTDIELDTDWNSRKEYVERDLADSPAEPLSTSQLEVSVAEHGVLQPPRVRFIGDGRYAAVFGFRRIMAAQKVAPTRPILCTVQPSSGDSSADDLSARFVNLSENLHREALHPWETAEALFQIKTLHPEMTSTEIAGQVGLTPSYVRNLIRLRTLAHEQVWKQFQRWGTSLRIPYAEVLSIAILPRERQLDAWNEALQARKSKTGKRGVQKRPGPAKLQKYYNAADTLQRSSDYRRGVKFGLSVALGKRKWS